MVLSTSDSDLDVFSESVRCSLVLVLSIDNDSVDSLVVNVAGAYQLT